MTEGTNEVAEDLRAWAEIDRETGKFGRAECMEGAADEIDRLQKRIRELEEANTGEPDGKLQPKR